MSNLVLTRRPGDAICIGADIIVRVVAINGNQVRLAIDAPRNVIVDREEIAIKRAAEALNHE